MPSCWEKSSQDPRPGRNELAYRDEQGLAAPLALVEALHDIDLMQVIAIIKVFIFRHWLAIWDYYEDNVSIFKSVFFLTPKWNQQSLLSFLFTIFRFYWVLFIPLPYTLESNFHQLSILMLILGPWSKRAKMQWWGFLQKYFTTSKKDDFQYCSTSCVIKVKKNLWCPGSRARSQNFK